MKETDSMFASYFSEARLSALVYLSVPSGPITDRQQHEHRRVRCCSSFMYVTQLSYMIFFLCHLDKTLGAGYERARSLVVPTDSKRYKRRFFHRRLLSCVRGATIKCEILNLVFTLSSFMEMCSLTCLLQGIKYMFNVLTGLIIFSWSRA